MLSKQKICKNCTHFFQTGMAMSMSDGNAGYCLLLREKFKESKSQNAKSIVEITDTCPKFKN
jgi:hypothetical protein